MEAESTIRSYADAVGYAWNPKSFEEILLQAEQLEGVTLKALSEEPEEFCMGIGAHDDILYSARINLHLFPKLIKPSTKIVILFGVNHRTKGVRDSLLFDTFSEWKGTYSNIKISTDLRDGLLARLEKHNPAPPEGGAAANPDPSAETDPAAETRIFYKHQTAHEKEHSIEAFIGWLQHLNKEIELLPIIIPRASQAKKLEQISSIFFPELEAELESRSLTLGEDVKILISNDCSHYGDEGFNNAIFGADEAGRVKALERDNSILDLAFKKEELKVEHAYAYLEHVFNFEEMKTNVPWCGIFPVGFGMMVAEKYFGRRGYGVVPRFLRFGDSYELGVIDSEGIRAEREVCGFPDVTAQRTLHHWVSYLAMGYLKKLR